MSQGLKINKGVELMLRREKKQEPEPEPTGFKFHHRVHLLKRKFNFKLEFTWEEDSN
tara:strand:+ start:118 stop:288 length:171 start_codon:yes stop_codon:yes gene_type:complete